jgi:hypothetical protein
MKTLEERALEHVIESKNLRDATKHKDLVAFAKKEQRLALESAAQAVMTTMTDYSERERAGFIILNQKPV